jgi:hypothetical protein
MHFFQVKTNYPRAPKYYIMKWLSDFIVITELTVIELILKNCQKMFGPRFQESL